MSIRAIAAVTGQSKNTVKGALREVGQIDPPAPEAEVIELPARNVVGIDGKTYRPKPTRQPRMSAATWPDRVCRTTRHTDRSAVGMGAKYNDELAQRVFAERVAQGLPPYVTDPGAIAKLVSLLQPTAAERLRAEIDEQPAS